MTESHTNTTRRKNNWLQIST